MDLPMKRRDFLAAMAATVAAGPAVAVAARPPEPTGVVYGRAGPAGFRAGTPARPERGLITLHDGRSLEVEHVTSWRIGPGKGILVASDGLGAWSILYAEA